MYLTLDFSLKSYKPIFPLWTRFGTFFCSEDVRQSNSGVEASSDCR